MIKAVSMLSISEVTLRRRTVLFGSAALSVWPWLAGCAAVPASPPPDDTARLLERARAYWAAIKANDRVTAWPYEAVSRDPNWSLTAYVRRGGGIVFHQAEVTGVDRIQGDEAYVNVEQNYDVPLARLRGVQAAVRDRWRRIDGQWYHDPVRSY